MSQTRFWFVFMLANAQLGNMLQSSYLHIHAHPSKGAAHAASVSDVVTPLNCSINMWENI